MPSFRPLRNRLRRILTPNHSVFLNQAVESWIVAPAETVAIPRGIWLTDEIDRVQRTEFGDLADVIAQMSGDPAEHVPATMAYRLRDVDLVDGVLHAEGGEMHLRARNGRRLAYHRPQQAISGAMYESWTGNRWFGNWLLNDCLAYRLAEAAGKPVTSMPVRGGHADRYEQLLQVTPERVANVHFDELILFDDLHNNSNRQARAQYNRGLLLAGRDPKSVPGVFLYRGRSGDARILENEDEIAERFESEFGFRTLYLDRMSADQLADAIGGARLAVGVEGSQMAHAVLAMAPGSTLLTLQPADRVTTSMKLLTDCWQQRFAMVIGQGPATGYRVDWDRILRVMDLIAAENP